MKRLTIDRLAEPQNLQRLVLALLVLVIIFAPLAGFAVVQASDAATRARAAIERVESGRKVGLAITCAATSAVIDAGRKIILSGATIRPEEYARNLQRLGAMSPRERLARTRERADEYARGISQAVGGTGVRGVVRADGTLNCSALRRAAKIGTSG